MKKKPMMMVMTPTMMMMMMMMMIMMMIMRTMMMMMMMMMIYVDDDVLTTAKILRVVPKQAVTETHLDGRKLTSTKLCALSARKTGMAESCGKIPSLNACSQIISGRHPW